MGDRQADSERAISNWHHTGFYFMDKADRVEKFCNWMRENVRLVEKDTEGSLL